MKNLLTNQEEPNQTLVVTPSSDKKHHAYAKDNPPSVAPQLQEPIKTQKTKSKSLSQESKLCYVKMRLNVLNIYHLYDL